MKMSMEVGKRNFTNPKYSKIGVTVGYQNMMCCES